MELVHECANFGRMPPYGSLLGVDRGSIFDGTEQACNGLHIRHGRV